VNCAQCGELLDNLDVVGYRSRPMYYDIDARPVCMGCLADTIADVNKRRIALTTIGDPPLTISTVHLGLDHNFSLTGPPLIFETMVFDTRGAQAGAPDLGICERYPTKEAALAGHDQIVQWVKENMFIAGTTEEIPHD
jgi:hypothetical protein